MASELPVAVVTGAGTGLGAATARQLVGAGWLVVGVGRRPEPLATTGSELGAAFVARPTDMADAASVTRLVADVIGEFGRLDALVNNAGSAQQVPVPQTTPDFFAATLAVNLVGPAAAITAAWAQFVRQGAGCIVNVSSLAQFDPFPGFFAYAASKAGLHLLTVVAHNEGATEGIRAFTVAPGVIDTDLHRRLMPGGVPAEFRHEPDQVAMVILECIAGDHDAKAGRTLAVVTPGVATFVREWLDGHPGGGIEIVER